MRVGGGRRELLSRREGKENEIDLRGLKGKRKKKGKLSSSSFRGLPQKQSGFLLLLLLRTIDSRFGHHVVEGREGERKTRRFCGNFPIRKLAGKMRDALWPASFGFFFLFLLPDLDSSYFSNGGGREAAKYIVAFCPREGTRSRQEDFEK